ncbi:MAG: DNA methyltransferase, partial [Geminicoccaceae bacterium]|nr:DNA methyltransferase [Geminicoccaceae bacterium]
SEATKAAFGYLAIALDTMLNYGNRSCRWDIVTQRVRSIFDRHDFAFCWSYAEMAPLISGLGYDWCIDKTRKCLEELIALVRPDSEQKLPLDARPAPPVTVTCKSADALDHLAEGSIDLVVVDPPYYDNVMYAELSDFFYVWLKRTAGRVFPELFRTALTDKDNEAVANPARFGGQKGAKELAYRDYRERMQRIFAECRRVLKPDGIMVLMFTHKTTGAWDALATGLIEAGFSVTASWPVETEAEGSMHQKDKAAASTTILLVCRPRAPAEETLWWEDLEPRVAERVREKVAEFQKAGLAGVDLYLACFGPALELFSRHWPVKRGRPAPRPLAARRERRAELLEEPFDPYRATPEDALLVARREVKAWRLRQLLGTRRIEGLDPLAEWFVLAWDAFAAPRFPFDEALQLARVVGVELEGEVVGRIAEKKGDEILLWDSDTRTKKHALGPVDGSGSWLDAVHHAARRTRTASAEAAKRMLEEAGVLREPAFLATLQALLEVLPVGRTFTGIEPTSAVAAHAEDFDALEKLRRVAFTDNVPKPRQLAMFEREAA